MNTAGRQLLIFSGNFRLEATLRKKEDDGHAFDILREYLIWILVVAATLVIFAWTVLFKGIT